MEQQHRRKVVSMLFFYDALCDLSFLMIIVNTEIVRPTTKIAYHKIVSAPFNVEGVRIS